MHTAEEVNVIKVLLKHSNFVIETVSILNGNLYIEWYVSYGIGHRFNIIFRLQCFFYKILCRGKEIH